MSANSVKIRIFWSASALDLSRRMSFLELVVVLRLELPGLVQELHDLVEVEEGLGDHLLYVVLGPVEALDRVEHLLGDDVFVVGLLAFLTPELELTVGGVAQHFGVLRLPALEALLLGVALAMNLKESEQLLEEAVAGELEGGDGALEALEKVGPDEAYHLSLAVLLERVDVLVRTPVPMQGVVHREREKRVLLREGLLEQVEHSPVGLADRVGRYLRVPPVGEGGCFAILPIWLSRAYARLRWTTSWRKNASVERGSPGLRSRAPRHPPPPGPHGCEASFPSRLKCARRLFTPIVRAK